ncbi:S1/P1 nuclease [Reyranella sp.]|uniref:S1/P1 nuclease n=1 Tax=Reyranella sp. TaxID=1929291 RepID=UPI003D11B669
MGVRPARWLRLLLSLLPLLSLLIMARPAWSWDPPGHELVGAVADRLLTPDARRHVEQLLGYNLETSSKWADCVRSVERRPDGSFVYDATTRYQHWCEAFMAPAEVARMEDYVRRNWSNCPGPGAGHGCHETYHFTDIDVQRGAYGKSFAGASAHDVVSAITAAIDVLEGRAAPPPFSIRDRKEALLMLAHFIGDLHQPLHAGAIYLDAEGRPVSPDRPGLDGGDIRTKGGSAIRIGDKNLHAMWDAVPDGWSLATQPELLTLAREVPKTPGPLASWPEQWASESVRQAAGAFAGVSIGPRHDGVWPAKLADPAAYEASAERIKSRQIARAGARLAAVLNTLWP